jgi:hypothetical protein
LAILQSQYWFTQPQSEGRQVSPEGNDIGQAEHFKPVGTVFILAMFVLTIILLWGSVYLILLSRGVTT